MLMSGTQNELFDLLVAAIWWTKAPELLKLFKRSEDEILDVRDPLGSSFVTTATWWLLKTKNLCISPN